MVNHRISTNFSNFNSNLFFFSKKFKTKILFQTGVIIFAVGTLFCSFAWNFSVLLIGRIIQAVGTSIVLPLMINIVLEEVPIEKRGYIMGIVGLVINFAPALRPVFGRIIIESMNWHWIFISMIPILIVSFILGSKHITDIRKNEKMSIDIPSVLLSAIAFSGIVYGSSMLGNSSWSDPKVSCYIIIGILSMFAFTYRQLHLKKPLIQLNVFKYPNKNKF
jgi:DHA2 family lincomycin resistance protein-like MFS transporter